MPILNRFIGSRPSLFFAALLLLIPFLALFIPAIIQAFYAEWFAGILGTIVVLKIVKKADWDNLHIPQTSLIFIGLIAFVCVQWMLGMLHSKQYAIMLIGYMLWALTLTILGAKLKHQYGWETITQYFAWSLASGGLLVSLLFTLQSYQLLPNSAIQPSHIVAYLSFALVSVIYLIAKQQLHSRLGFVLITVFIAAISASASWLGWLLITVLVIVLIAQQILAIKQQNGNRQRRTLVRLGLALIPLLMITHYLTPDFVLAHAPKNMLSFALPVTQNTQTYLDIWKTSWQIYTSSPWLGVGMGNIAWHSYLTIQAPALPGQVGVFSHTHNQWLQLLVTLGAGGLLLATVGLVGWIISVKWRYTTLESWWLIAMLMLMLAHSMIEPQLGYAYFLAIFALLLGMGDEKTTLLKLPVLGSLASVIYISCFTIVLGSTFVAYQKLNLALPLAQKQQLTKQEEATLHEQLKWVHNYTILAPYAQLVYAKGLRVGTANLGAKLWLSDAALRFRPSKKLAYKHVLLLKLNGEHEQAVAFLKRSLNAYPMKITSQLELFSIEYYQDYLDVLSEARPIKLKPHSPNNTSPNLTL